MTFLRLRTASDETSALASHPEAVSQASHTVLSRSQKGETQEIMKLSDVQDLPVMLVHRSRRLASKQREPIGVAQAEPA